MSRFVIIAVACLMLFQTAEASSLMTKNVYTDGIDGVGNKAVVSAYDMDRHYGQKLKTTDDKINDKAKDLEAVLISVMVDPMFPKGKESGLYGGGQGSDIYRMMMIEQYGKMMSEHGGLGIAKNITKELTANKKGAAK